MSEPKSIGTAEEKPEPPVIACSLCGQGKTPQEFYKWALARNGLRGRCKECLRHKERARSALSRDKTNQRKRAWAQKNREKLLPIKRASYHRNKAKSAAYALANRE